MKSTYNYLKIKCVGILLLLILFSCNENKFDIDVSDIDAKVRFENMNHDVFDKSKNIESKHSFLENKYHNLYQIYCQNMLDIPPNINTKIGLEKYINDDKVNYVNTEINKHFDNSKINIIKNEIENAFKHYKYYFPDSATPKIIFINSNFKSDTYVFDSIVTIGLDMYLGEEHEIIEQIPFEIIPQYLRPKLKEENIATDVITQWLKSRFDNPENSPKLIEEIIKQGKIMYLVDAMLPKNKNYQKFRYTEEELKWCEDNLTTIWKYLIENKYLYSSKIEDINRFIGPGPNTALLPKNIDSPSNVGVWLGWKIVVSYMSKNPSVNLQSLINNANYQEIIDSFNYKS